MSNSRAEYEKRMHDLLGRPRFGISHDDPSITAPDQCRYDACAEVPGGFVASGNALRTVVPGGRYDPDTGTFACETCIPVAPL